MIPMFILIRGNSGSGKTFFARQLQEYFGSNNCLLLQQDILRREILHANDRKNTPAIKLIETLVDFGRNNYNVIILEGILREDVYGRMLRKVVSNFGEDAFVYYLDVSFETTIKYNQMKNNSFTMDDLKKWWREKDYLGTNDEIRLSGDTKHFFDEIIQNIELKGETYGKTTTNSSRGS